MPENGLIAGAPDENFETDMGMDGMGMAENPGFAGAGMPVGDDDDDVTELISKLRSDDADDLFHKKLKTVLVPTQEISIDTDGSVLDKILAEKTELDISKIESFTQVSQQRETIMDLLDTMAEDPIIGAVLNIYADDATEPNEQGKIIWAESSDSDTAQYVNYIIDVMNIDKYAHSWIRSLALYGDLYIKLFRVSDVDDGLFKERNNKQDERTLNENVFVSAHAKTDKYVHYVEAVPNPAEMFELTKFGKSYAYIQAGVRQTSKKDRDSAFVGNSVLKYQFNRDEVILYQPTDFVHAYLNPMSNRFPEEVEIFIDNSDPNTFDSVERENLYKQTSLTYTVRRGESLFFNVFKIWRIMMLLQNAMLLNRLTKSSIVRVVGVEVGDQPKEEQRKQLLGIKQFFEQKTALSVDNALSEYTNPGPMENNIYVPTHEGTGSISIQSVGGDTEVKGLSDVDYFRNLLFGALGLPKEYFGFDEGGGFDGGTSLSLKSTRYARSVKKLQTTFCQALTDIINLVLIDSGQDSRINKFSIKMQSPATQEEKDKMQTKSEFIDYVSKIMDMLDSLETPSRRLSIMKILMKSEIHDPEITDIIQEEIEKLEKLEEIEMEQTVAESEEFMGGFNDHSAGGLGGGMDFGGGIDFGSLGGEAAGGAGEEAGAGAGSLPSPSELGAGDMADADFS